MSDELKDQRKQAPAVEDVDDFSVVPVSKKVTPPEKDNEPKKKTSPAIRKVVCIAVAVVVILVVAFSAYGAFVPQDKIHSGITVNGIDIGGMSENEAVLALTNANSEVKSEVGIVANGKRFIVKTAEIDAVLDIEATAKKAFNVAKGGNIFKNASESLKVRLSGGEFLPVITFNEEKFAEKINEIGIEAVGSQLIEHSVRFDGSGVGFIVPGTSGYNNDPAPVMAMIKDALLKSESTDIEVEFEKTKPQKMTVDLLESLVNSEPADASFVLEDGEVKVIDAIEGRKIDRAKCEKIVSKVSEGGSEVEFSYDATEPELKSEDVKGKIFNGELGSYTTRYAPGGNRGSNVAIAASKINGKILLPGETFSFNKTVGKRSVANGFKPAPEYQNGQTVTGIGGGTCQVSTTVYSAVLYADLKVVKRSNHSMSVSYVPLGQDATVTDSGIDLQFMNDTKYPVKISAVTGGGKITVTIIGTKPDSPKTVKISHKSVDGGIRTTRYVYDSEGNLIKEENMGMSKYKPHSDENDEGNATPSASPAPSEAPAENATDEPTESSPSQAPETSQPAEPTETQQPVATKTPAISAPEVPSGSSDSSNSGSTPMKTEE